MWSSQGLVETLAPRRSQIAKPISFSPASGPPLKCNSTSASLPAGLPLSFEVIFTVIASFVMFSLPRLSRLLSQPKGARNARGRERTMAQADARRRT